MTADCVTLAFPARPEYLLLARLALTGVARAGGAEEDVLADLRLAVTEAAANVVRHAYADGDGDIMLAFTLTGSGRLEVIVEDDGPGFDEADVASWEPTDLGEDGMGLAIIRAVADEVEIGSRHDSSGTRLRFSRALSEPRQAGIT
jgi:serine/threonine-protein kinase RsbW